MSERSTKRGITNRGVMTALAMLGVAACSGNPDTNSAAYKQGSLGKGGFLFGCSDGVACQQWSTGDAANFPKDGVALGSTFTIRFVPTGDETGPSVLDLGDPNADVDGITVKGLSPFFSGGPEGISATDRPGYGAIVAQYSNGTVIDFIPLQIVKPTSLTIYDASVTGNDATDIGDTIALKVGDTKSFRTVGKGSLNQPLAGSIRVDWQSTAPTIATVDSVTDGVAKIVGRSAGSTAKLTLVGGGFTRNVALTVTP